MPEFIVKGGLFGVKAGTRVTIDNPHPALLPNLTPVGFQTEGANVEALIPEPVNPLAQGGQNPDGSFIQESNDFDWEIVRQDLISELDDAGTEYDADAPAADLALLLDEEVREGIKMSAE